MKLDDAIRMYSQAIGHKTFSGDVFEAIRVELIAQAAEIVAQQKQINDLTETVCHLSGLIKNHLTPRRGKPTGAVVKLLKKYC